MSLRALIFDMNGVIIDDEPIHMRLFQDILKGEGILISKEEYDEYYLALDDRACFLEVFRRNGKILGDEKLQAFIIQKAKLYEKEIEKSLIILPGVVEFVMAAAQQYPLAVASGALRKEVDFILQAAGISNYIDVIVASEDVERSKPDPEAFMLAVKRLNENGFKKEPALKSEECLVIEDSKHGVSGAHRAGMKCLAVSNSFPPDILKKAGADKIVPVLTAAKIEDLQDLFKD